MLCTLTISFSFFFNDTATTEIYTLSLHDALPISRAQRLFEIERCLDLASRFDQIAIRSIDARQAMKGRRFVCPITNRDRSEEHTSELQSRLHLVCRLLLEKKKKKTQKSYY